MVRYYVVFLSFEKKGERGEKGDTLYVVETKFITKKPGKKLKKVKEQAARYAYQMTAGMDAGMTVLYGMGVSANGSVQQLGRYYKHTKTNVVTHIPETAVIQID